MQKRFELFVLGIALVISSSGMTSAQTNSQPAAIEQVPVVSKPARPLFTLDGLETNVAQQPPGPPPTPRHTEIKAMTKDLVTTFKYLPSMENLDGTGADNGLALVARPFDDNVNEALVGNDTAADFAASANWLPREIVQHERGPFQHLFTTDPDVFAPTVIDGLTAAQISGQAFDPIASMEGLSASGFAQQTAQKPPPPARTGFKALLFETGHDFVTFPRRQSTWVILAIGGGAAALAHPADDEVNAKLVGSDAVGKLFAPGKYIGAVYTQAGVAVGLYFVGRYWLPHKEGEPRTNKVSHLGFDMLRAIIVSQALTQGIKYAVGRDRPTGECCAFPSGHASATFATASVLERHFGYRGSWPMFLVATYVSMSRLHDNRHFLSDVLFGSALGMASGWTVVGRHGRDVFALTPVPTRGGIGLAVSWRPQEQRSTASRH
jgi:membrane-associated phospholipid phosphatase